jgi:hypothetical protein
MPTTRTSRLVGIVAVGLLALTPALLSSSRSGGGTALAASVSPRPALGLGHARTLRAGKPITPPDRAHPERRAYAGAAVATETSTNWSGYGGEAATAFDGAEGIWTVPTVLATTGRALYSASWVGADGFDNQYLIQTGTEQDTSSGGANYYPWYEIITPTDLAPEIQINSTVEPGDAIYASVEKIASGTWQIYLSDTTRGWYFDQDFSYAGPGSSAEWIEEAPAVDNDQSTPADWGTVDFARTALYNGTNWDSTAMTSANAIDLVDNNGNALATPGPITPPATTGQSFADVFGGTAITTPPTTTTTAPTPITAPSAPTGVTAWADRRAIHLRWRAPRTDGGLPVARYDIREYTGGRMVKLTYSTSPTIKVTGLNPQRRYLFTVAASNGRHLSTWSAHTAALRPRS